MRFLLTAYFGLFAFGCATQSTISLVYVHIDEPRGGKIVVTKDPEPYPNEMRILQAQEQKIMSYVCGSENYRVVDEGIEIPQGEVAAYSLARDKNEAPYLRRQYKNFVCDGKPLEFGNKSGAPLPEPPSPKKKN